MKNKITLLSLALFLSIGMFAQAPNLINYQAVARDASGVPLIGTSVNVLFEIRQSTPNGVVVYSETHATNTNQFGLFNLAIGAGTPTSGTFAGVNWSTGLYYLHIEVDPGGGYQDLGETQLLSVPYALHANTAASGTPGADGNNSLTNVTPEPSGANCANGGYLVEVGVDDNGDQTLQALEVDLSYYVCNGLDGAANNNDTSATNEIQALSISNDTIFLSNGGFVVLPTATGDNWGTDVVNTTGGNILGDGTVGNPLAVTDNDTSATNELELPMTGNNVGDVLKWNGSAWVNANDSIDDADNDPANEIELPPTAILNQVLTWNGTAWVAQNPGAGADNWGSQVVITSGGNISGDGTAGNPLAVTDNDTSATNELQNLSITGNTINITNGTGATISATTPNTGEYLYWNGVNWVSQAPAANTDNQNLGNGGKVGNSQTITIQNGTGVTFSVADEDSSITNEIQTISFSDPNLTLSNGGGSVNLSTLQGTDSQTLTYNSGTQNLSISNGNSVTLDVNDADADPNNERITTFSVNGTNDSLIIVEAGVGHAMPLSDLSDGDWIKGAGFLYNNADDIVVGNNVTDNAKFHIRRLNGAPQTILKLGNSNQPSREWSFDVNGSGDLALLSEGGGTPYSFLHFAETNRFLGINTTSPAQNLHVEGNNAIIRLQSTQATTGANSYIEFGNTTSGTFNSKGWVGNPGSGDHLQYEATTFHRFTTQGTERMRLTNTGDLIMGNFTAFSQLDVAGQITMRTGANPGWIPVSDNNGTMTWTDPSTISTASFWTSTNTGSIHPTIVSDFVGIGTNNAQDNLHISDPNPTIRLEDNDSPIANTSGTMQVYDQSNTLVFEVGQSTIGGRMVSWAAGEDLHFQSHNGTSVNTRMKVSGTNGFVGIGQVGLPSALLTVQPDFGTAATSVAQFKAGAANNIFDFAYDASNSANLTMLDGAGSNLVHINTAGTSWFNGGNVGIGTTTPGSLFEVRANNQERAGQFISNFASNSNKYGSYGLAMGGGTGENIGSQGEATGATTNKGIVGRAFGGTNNWSGYFEQGNFYVENDIRIGTTNDGANNPKVYIHTPTGSNIYTSLEALNEYSGTSLMYGYYNRMIASGTGGMTGVWNYMTPSASSSSVVYGVRNLIQSNGNGVRYSITSNVLANGSGDMYGTSHILNHDGSGDVYGFRIDASSTTTSGSTWGLWIAGPLNMENYIGGNTGIGVQTPQNRLDVEGAAVIGATYSGTNTAPGNGLLVAGQTGIGTTTPVARLQVSEPNGGDPIIRAQNGGTTHFMVANSGNTALYYNLTPAYKLTLNTNSAAKPTSSAWTVASDKRLKTGVSQFSDGLNVLMQINPVWFKYTGEAGMPTDEKGVGTLAQELQEIAPYMVHEWEYQEGSTTETEGRGSLGEVKKYLGVDYGAMDFILINAIKEQQKMIEELRQEIQELKNKQ